MEDYKQKTIFSYDKHTQFYAEKFKRLLDLQKEKEFPKFISLLPGKKVLDLGCGAGDHAFHFSQQGLDVTCIDLSEEMIKLCQEKGLKALVMDIENLDFPENVFDGIWAVTSLLHVPKDKITAVITKLHQILRERGILYICIKEGGGEGLLDDPNDPATKRFFSFWKKEEFLDLFKKEFLSLDFKRVELGRSVFLEFLFKKK